MSLSESQNIASKEDNNKEEIEENKKSNTAVTEQHMNDENTTKNVDTAIEGGLPCNGFITIYICLCQSGSSTDIHSSLRFQNLHSVHNNHATH